MFEDVNQMLCFSMARNYSAGSMAMESFSPINTGDSEQKVKSEEYFFVSLVKKRNKGKGEGC